MVNTACKVAGGVLVAISFAASAPLSVLACSGGTASTTGGGTASTTGGGGGFSNPFGPIDPNALTDAVVAGFTLLIGLAALSVLVAVVMMRRRQRLVPSAQLSPDGMYWWDGAFWRPIPAAPAELS